MAISEKTVGRLSLYRRMLYRLVLEGCTNVYSHQIAVRSGTSPAQVRRDLMVIGYSGSPNSGYRVQELIRSLGEFLDDPQGQRAALVGIGNLGRAILSYFSGRRPLLKIVAAFDIMPERVGRTLHGCRCYPMTDLATVVKREDISLGLVTVPAEMAQNVAETYVDAGVRGILNFAPVTLKLSSKIYVADFDMTMALEKVAYFTRQHSR